LVSSNEKHAEIVPLNVREKYLLTFTLNSRVSGFLAAWHGDTRWREPRSSLWQLLL